MPQRSVKKHALFAALVLFLAHDLSGQAAPPLCPVSPTAPARSMRPPAPHPSSEAIRATAAAAAADPTILISAEPVPNFGTQRYLLADYADCIGNNGCYWADLDAQTRRAEAELDHLVATHKKDEKLAIVLDIDETSLSGYCEEKREDFGFIPSMFNEWIVSPQASIPIPGTLRLFNHARELGVAVFFLTGRSHEQTEATAKNLERAGYKDWKGLILRDESERNTATTAYKSSERAKIVAQGYQIVLNMGDQWSDLNCTPRAEFSVKLPNPFYYLP
jgi:acid phosphatase